MAADPVAPAVLSAKGFVATPAVPGNTGFFAVTFVVPAKTVGFIPLLALAALLDESPKAFRDTRTALRKTMVLLNAAVSFGARKVRDLNLFTMEVSFVRDRAAKGLWSLERRTLRLAARILDRGPKLDPLSLTLAQGKLLRANADARGAAEFKALLGLADNFLPDLAATLRAGLDDERIKALTAADVAAAYRILRQSPSFVSAAGSSKIDRVLQRRWGRIDGPFDRGRPTPVTARPDDLSVIDGGNTTAVAIAYALPGYVPRDEKGRALAGLLSDMLQDGDSVLFAGLREQGGFTYAPNVDLFDDGRVLVLSFVTDAAKKDRALKAADALMLKAYGLFTPAQLENAKKDRESRYLGICDSAEGLARLNAEAFLTGRKPGVADRLEAVGATTLAAVKDYAAKIAKIGSFTVVGDFREDD